MRRTDSLLVGGGGVCFDEWRDGGGVVCENDEEKEEAASLPPAVASECRPSLFLSSPRLPPLGYTQPSARWISSQQWGFYGVDGENVFVT